MAQEKDEQSLVEGANPATPAKTDVTATTTTTTTTTAGGAGAGGVYTRSETSDDASSKFGIIALGAYLVLMTILSVFVLGVLMMAENPPETTDADGKKQICCGAECRYIIDAAPATAKTPESNSNTAVNSNAAKPTPTASPAATAVNTNGGNANTAAPANVSPTPNNSTPVNRNTIANQNTNATNANTNKTAVIKQELPEITVPPYLCIDKFGFGFLSADSYMFLVVLFAGMLGALIRGMSSFFKHLGFGDFSFKWTGFYLLLPFTGATLSLIIYFVIRGGFYGGSFGKGLVLNVFAFAALAALTGLFSENAMEKLRQVAVTLLADVPPKVTNSKEIVDKKKEAEQGKP